MINKKCLYCDKELTDKRRKYCHDLHKYRYECIVDNQPKKFSHAQYKRMVKAGRSLSKGKLGVRYN